MSGHLIAVSETRSHLSSLVQALWLFLLPLPAFISTFPCALWSAPSALPKRFCPSLFYTVDRRSSGHSAACAQPISPCIQYGGYDRIQTYSRISYDALSDLQSTRNSSHLARVPFVAPQVSMICSYSSLLRFCR